MATNDAFWITRNPVGFAREVLRARRQNNAPRPPSPRGRPFTGVLREYQADPFGYLQHLGDVYGDVYRLPLPSYDVVILNHPDHVRHVMTHRDGEYSMIGPVSWVRHVLGTSMNMLEGEEFRQRRKLLTPMMSRRQLTKIAAIVADEFANRLAKWDRFADNGGQIDLQDDLADLLAPAFLRAMFSLALPEAELHQLMVDIRVLFYSVAAPLFLGPPPRLLPGPENPVQAWRRMRRWVNRQIDQRLADSESYDDIMQVVLDARYGDGTPISRRDAITDISCVSEEVTKTPSRGCRGRSGSSHIILKPSSGSTTRSMRSMGQCQPFMTWSDCRGRRRASTRVSDYRITLSCRASR